MSNLKQIGIALAQYEMDFNGLPYHTLDQLWGDPETFIAEAKYNDPKNTRWTSVLYNHFLVGAGYINDTEFFHCPAYGESEVVDDCNYSPNAALIAANGTDRYPGAIFVGDGYGPYRLRCKDYSFRWRHGAAKMVAGATEIGQNTTSGNGNYLLADGSVQVKNASARATVCREGIGYLGTGKTRNNLYKDEHTDHPNCGGVTAN